MKVNLGRFPKDPQKERKISVKIDPWDTWNMDHTLALIIVPLLKQLKEQKGGAPFVEDEDVPDELKRGIPWDSVNFDTDDKWFERWDYVVGEMIFAFENKLTDWEDQFWVREPIIDFDPTSDDSSVATEIYDGTSKLKWKDRGEYDREGSTAFHSRMLNGFRLFGKYYEGLWT